MLKKLGVTLIALLATFSVVYAANNELNASTTAYNAGGAVTGRINKAPSNLGGGTVPATIGLRKGDKVYGGDAEELGWQLIEYNKDYTTYEYNCVAGACTIPTNSPPLSSWLAFADTKLNNTYLFPDSISHDDLVNTGFAGGAGVYTYLFPYLKTEVYSKLKVFNDNYKLTDGYVKLAAPRNLQREKLYMDNSNAIHMHYIMEAKETIISSNNKEPFTFAQGYFEGFPGGTDMNKTVKPFILKKDLAFSEGYHGILNQRNSSTADKVYNRSITADGDVKEIHNNFADKSSIYWQSEYNLATRPAIYFDLSNVVFGTSIGESQEIATVTEPVVPSAYTKLYLEGGESMKLRVLDSAIAIDFKSIKGQTGEAAITKAAQNGSVKLEANALAGEDTNGNPYTVSALVFDSKNKFAYYKPLATAAGEKLYDFDTTGMAEGTYKIALVNEAYNEASTSPANSSLITATIDLEIVAPQILSYTAAPLSQATYEYDKNVEVGQKIGTLTRSNGLAPIRYTIVGDGDESYKNFEINGLDENGDSSATSLDVKVKTTGAPDVIASTSSLKAGTYKFCIESKDVNGNPVTQVVGKSKVCTSLEVKKATPTISFSAAKKDIKIGATVSTEIVTTTNTDTLALTDITFVPTGGVTNVLTVSKNATNPLGYDLSVVNEHIGTGLPTTFTLTASIKATDNYLAATTTVNQSVYVYKELSELTWTPKKSAYPTEDVVNNSTIGSLLASGGVGPYKYEMSASSDGDGYVAVDAEHNSSFAVVSGASVAAGKSADVKTTSTLAVGTYKVQFKVTDSKAKTVFKSAEIVVSSKVQSAVDFKDKAGGSIITGTGITMKFNEPKSLFAEGGSTSELIEYYAAEQKDQPSNINPVEYLDVNKTNGELTPIKVGTTKVYAKRPGDGIFGSAISTFMSVKVEQALQSIAFNIAGSSSNVGVGSTITEDASGKVTLDNTPGKGGITYTSSDPTKATVDATGKVTGVTTGDVIITATLNDSNNKGSYNANYETKSITKTITVYDGMGVSFGQSDTPQAETPSAAVGSPIGSLTVGGGSGTKKYAVSTSDDASKNKDASFFSVDSTTGVVSLKEAVNASDIANTYDAENNTYYLYVQFDATDELNNKVTTDAKVQVKGAVLNAEFETGNVGKIIKEYAKDGKFNVGLSVNPGNGVPTYRIKDDSTQPSDVLRSVASNGQITIENVNDKKANPKPVMIEAVIPPAKGYDGETIEVEVEITKAPQPTFGFKNKNIVMSTNSTMTPILAGKLSTGTTSITSKDASIIEVNGTDIVSNTNEGSAVITVIDAGDRNYKTATNTATVEVSSTPAYTFIIGVPTATYGQTGLSATVEANELEEIRPGAEGVLTWESSDPTIADIDEDGNITIYKAGSVEITCTQTSVGDPTVRSSATMVVKPKPITVTINDKSKYVGEVMPTFDMIIPDGALVGDDEISEPTFSCIDESKEVVNDNTNAGTYPITGSYVTGSNPNYDIKVNAGSLVVIQDTSLATWFHLEGVTSGKKLSANDWHKEDVNIVLDTAVDSAGTYDEISLDKTVWNTSITVTNEDENSEDVHFRIGEGDLTHPLALASSQSTTIKIDKTKPIIKSITGTQTNKDAISQLINKVTFGTFFKPGTKVSIVSEDILPLPTSKVSGIKEITYSVYEIDKTTGIVKTVPKDTGTLTPDTTGNSEVTLKDTGLYRVCATVTDTAGNISSENCSDLNIKKIDIDADGDGTVDFVDPDGDGCPDINIVWENADKTWNKLNMDITNDKLPDINIDSDSDGKADINVDQDDDKTPDLNIVDIKTWNPAICVTGQPDEYCTDDSLIPNRNIDLNKDGRPDINIDLDDDGIPDIDIDTDGDGKADINIDSDKDGTADKKLKVMKEWVLDEKVFEVTGRKFHTMTGLTEDAIDQLEDGGVIAKPGNGQIFLPNYSLKVTDKTEELDEETKKNLQEIAPDKTIKKYLTIDLTKDDVTIQPDGTLSISIPIDEAIKNPKVMIEQADGTFVEAKGTLKDGVFTYETSFVGGVVVFGDDESIKPDNEPEEIVKPSLPVNNPDTSVKGSYTGGIGGAGTGDSTSQGMLVIGGILSLTILFFLTYKRRKEE